jgi:hypothetical protein
MPIEWKNLNEEEEDNWWSPKRFLKQELLELSGVSVPSNPNALQNAFDFVKAKGYKQGNLIVDYIFKGAESVPLQEKIKVAELKEELDKTKRKVEYEEETDSFMIQVPKEYDVEMTKEMVEDEEKPYKNEHACRLKEPDYDKYARKNCEQKHDGKCIDVIYGIKGDKAEIQALRYPKDIWTEKKAKEHCKSRGGIFEAAAKESSIIPDKDKAIITPNPPDKKSKMEVKIVMDDQVREAFEGVTKSLEGITKRIAALEESDNTEKIAGLVIETLKTQMLNKSSQLYADILMHNNTGVPKVQVKKPEVKMEDVKLKELTEQLKRFNGYLKNLNLK